MPRRAALVLLVVLAAACSSDPPEYRVTLDTDLGREPAIQMPDGEPPGELLVQDVVTGEGEVLREGDTFTVHYVGVSWQRREIFDRTWPGEPASFGWDGVIDGWRRGIAGMRVGGRRGLVVPPELGYDDGETMIFVVDLLGVQRPAEVGAGAGEAPAP